MVGKGDRWGQASGRCDERIGFGKASKNLFSRDAGIGVLLRWLLYVADAFGVQVEVFKFIDN